MTLEKLLSMNYEELRAAVEKLDLFGGNFDCVYCNNCFGCVVCVDCGGCKKCRACINCVDCSECTFCIGCKNCYLCSEQISKEYMFAGKQYEPKVYLWVVTLYDYHTKKQQ